MRKCLFLLTAFLMHSILANGQPAGHVYQFLENPHNARTESLGGTNISITDNDASLTLANPSLITPSMDGQITFNSVFYYAGINYGYTGYTFKHKKYGMLNAGVKYMYYGRFTRADELGLKDGEFYAGDFSFNLGWAAQLDSQLTVGANVKPIVSFLEQYNSYGIAFDLGANYRSQNKLFSASLVLSNFGVQIGKYHKADKRGALPLNIMLGVTQKLQHAPLRFSFTARNLETPNLRYDEPEGLEQALFLGAEAPGESKLDKAMDYTLRHFVIGAEILPSDNFYIALGYNYRRRQELKYGDTPGMVGFSWGFGLSLKRFRFSYGRSTYHISGGTNYFSFLVDLDDWKKL